ncbi:MAG: hypothetical protein ACHQ4H_11975, partial [Ktedonobacterales bacterium]
MRQPPQQQGPSGWDDPTLSMLPHEAGRVSGEGAAPPRMPAMPPLRLAEPATTPLAPYQSPPPAGGAAGRRPAPRGG